MKRRVFLAVVTGALLAAPQPHLAEPRVVDGAVRWFTLNETSKEVEALIGPPVLVSDFGSDFRSWQYRFGGVDEHDYSHFLVFRRSTGRLISVTRAYDPDQSVDTLFPDAESRVVSAAATGAAQYGARVRRLPGGLILIGMGSLKSGQPASQLALIREQDLKAFFPWIAESLSATTQR